MKVVPVDMGPDRLAKAKDYIDQCEKQYPDNVLLQFMIRIYREGLLKDVHTPEEVQARIFDRLDKPEGVQIHQFVVCAQDSLNETAPAEALAGQIYAVEGRESRFFYQRGKGAETVPWTDTERAAVARLLGYPFEVRVQKVLQCVLDEDKVPF